MQVLGIMNQGGAENMVMNIYRTIDRKEIQFDFIVHTNDKGFFDDEIDELGGRIFRCPKYSIANHLAYKKWWNDFFANSNYKIIHSHIRSTASIFLSIAKKYGLTTIIHSHSTSNGSGFKALIKNFLQKRIIADYYFACSRKAGEWLFGRKIVNNQRFHIIKNAIDVDKFKYDSIKREKMRRLLSIEDKQVYIHIGRFHKSKNHTFLLHLFSLISKRKPNSVLLLIGDGELKNNIEKYAHKLNIFDKVLFVGETNKVCDYLQASDCFLFPSKWEGLGIVAVEAQASGIKSICSDSIPKEAQVTDLCKFLPLDECDMWLNEALNLDYKRTNTSMLIKRAGYDISATSSSIQSFYLEVLKYV